MVCRHTRQRSVAHLAGARPPSCLATGNAEPLAARADVAQDQQEAIATGRWAWLTLPPLSRSAAAAAAAAKAQPAQPAQRHGVSATAHAAHRHGHALAPRAASCADEEDGCQPPPLSHSSGAPPPRRRSFVVHCMRSLTRKARASTRLARAGVSSAVRCTQTRANSRDAACGAPRCAGAHPLDLPTPPTLRRQRLPGPLTLPSFARSARTCFYKCLTVVFVPRILVTELEGAGAGGPRVRLACGASPP